MTCAGPCSDLCAENAGGTPPYSCRRACLGARGSSGIQALQNLESQCLFLPLPPFGDKRCYFDSRSGTFRARDLGTFEYPTFLVSGVYASPRIIRVVGPWSRYQKRFRLLERMYQRCMHIKRSFPKPPRTLQFPVTLVTYTRISL